MSALYFEQAFNEHMRLCLKLDELFQHIEQGLLTPTSTAHQRLAVESVLHAVTLLDRPDFKSKLIKELNRLAMTFQRLMHSDRVNQIKLTDVLSQLLHLSEQLQFTEGKLAQSLRENDFLNALRIQQSNPGGLCLSESPAYRLWLTQAPHEQQQDLRDFLQHFSVMQQAISLLLHLVRDSALPQSKIAEHGFYQMSLDAQQLWQLLRIELPKQTGFFPETSIGRHGISVRFYPLKAHDKRRTQTEQDIVFKLTLCCL